MLSKHSLITSVLICVVVGERNAQHLGELSGVVNYSSDHQDCLPHPPYPLTLLSLSVISHQ